VKYVQHYRLKYRLQPYGIHRSYATKNGGPVVREKARGWRDVNGIWIHIPKHIWFVLFRRAA
jgi:hypothetical protein